MSLWCRNSRLGFETKSLMSFINNWTLHCCVIISYAYRQMPLLTQVQRALRAFDKLETLTDLEMVDEDAPTFNETLHERIFVAEEVETLLQEHGTGDAACLKMVSLTQCNKIWLVQKPMFMHYSGTVKTIVWSCKLYTHLCSICSAA